MVGEISVGSLWVTITPLSHAEESALDRILRKAAEDEAGDHYTRCKRELAAASGADRVEMVREITRNAIQQVKLSPAAFWLYRTSPAGTATEIFQRGKKATPGLTREGLAAAITDANVDEVSAQLFEILENGDPKATP